jgi:hypothetical protein
MLMVVKYHNMLMAVRYELIVPLLWYKKNNITI